MQIKEAKIDQEYIEKPVVLTSKWYLHYNKALPSNAYRLYRQKQNESNSEEIKKGILIKLWEIKVPWSPKKICPFCTGTLHSALRKGFRERIGVAGSQRY